MRQLAIFMLGLLGAFGGSVSLGMWMVRPPPGLDYSAPQFWIAMVIACVSMSILITLALDSDWANRGTHR